MAAHAEVRGEIAVTLPFDFVAGGTGLPAGTYTVSSLSLNKYGGLLLFNYDARASVFVRATEVHNAGPTNPK